MMPYHCWPCLLVDAGTCGQDHGRPGGPSGQQWERCSGMAGTEPL